MLVAALTLVPRTPNRGGVPFLCLPCGDVGLADGLLNVGLFMPLGLLLRSRGGSIASAAVAGVLVSGGIELLQTLIPGRFPTAADIVFNGAGAVLGWLAVRRYAHTRPGWLEVGAGGVAVLVLTAWLARTAPPPGDLFGQHTPDLGQYDRYGGRLVEARVGGRDVANGRAVDPDRLRRGLEEGTVDVRFVAGPPPEGWAPVFAVFSGAREEALVVAVRNGDMLVRFRTRAGAAGLRETDLVVRGALDDIAAGDTVRVAVSGRNGGRCVAVAGRETCGLGLSPTEGWRTLLGLAGAIPTFAVIALAGALSRVSQGTRAAKALVALTWTGLIVLLPRFTASAPVPIHQLVWIVVWGSLGVREIGPARPRTRGSPTPPA